MKKFSRSWRLSVDEFPIARTDAQGRLPISPCYDLAQVSERVRSGIMDEGDFVNSFCASKCAYAMIMREFYFLSWISK